MDKKEVLYRMMLIREMEHKIESLFSQGLLRGTTHCCIGQEAVPAAMSYLIDINRDYLCSGHRAHGLSMMMTMKPETLLGEIMGKPYGMAKGLGGSQHVYYKNYFTNGITGAATIKDNAFAGAITSISLNNIADGATIGDGSAAAFASSAGAELTIGNIGDAKIAKNDKSSLIRFIILNIIKGVYFRVTFGSVLY